MQSQTLECLFRKCKCRPTSDVSIKQLRETNVVDFIHRICSMCVKKQYSATKELLAKRRYVVVNTL